MLEFGKFENQHHKLSRRNACFVFITIVIIYRCVGKLQFCTLHSTNDSSQKFIREKGCLLYTIMITWYVFLPGAERTF